MPSGYYSNKSKKPLSRKLAAARTAVNRARSVLGARASAPNRSYGPPATRGFYGLYSKRGRDELKVCDVSGATIQALSSGAVTLINGVSQGTDYTNRIGRKILVKSLFMRFNIYPNSAISQPTGDLIRVLLLCDYQPNGAAPTTTDILQTADYLSPLNLNNRDRFKVWYDKYISMEASYYPSFLLTAGSPAMHFRQVFKKMSMEVINSGSGATVGSIQTGAMYIFVISKSTGTLYDFNTRVRFIDG